MEQAVTTARIIAITLNGQPRSLKYGFAALKRLGMKGPGDGEGFQNAAKTATETFDGAADFILAGLLHEKKDDTREAVLAGMEDWGIETLGRVIGSIAGNDEQQNGNGGARQAAPNPPNASIG